MMAILNFQLAQINNVHFVESNTGNIPARFCQTQTMVSETNTKLYEKEFEDTKAVIRIRISNKNTQHNGQKKKYKRTNNDLQNIQTIEAN